MNKDILFEQSNNELIVPHICKFYNTPYPAHWQNSVEFLYCYKGEAIVYIDSEPITFKQGDTIVINYRQIHTFETNTGAEWYCLIFSEYFYENCHLDINKIYFENSIKNCSASHFMEKLCNIYDKKEYDGYWIEIHKLALDYFSHMYQNHRVSKCDFQTSTSRKQITILKALEFIDNNFSEKITVDDVANYVGYSRFHFVRMFKEYTDTTVQNIINIKRIEKGKELLKTTTLSTEKIAAKCGFDNPSYFSKVFKNFSGYLPSDYRKNKKI